MPQCRAERVDFHGWEAVRLSNGLAEAIIIPDAGGRIIAYNLGSHRYLWMDERLAGKLIPPDEQATTASMSTWLNYGGSKTWPAPQGWDNEDLWHGPPDPVLDGGRYALEAVEASDEQAVVRVQSPRDLRTGIQISRQLTLHRGSSHATLHLEMQNISARARTWSIWDVVQLEATLRSAGGETHNEQAWLYVPMNPDSRFPRGYNVMYGEHDNPEWQPGVRPGVLGAQYLFRVGKIGLDSNAGWLAYVDGQSDYAFCQRFAYLPGASYPDGGASVECWTTGLGRSAGDLDYSSDPMYYLEAEVLGPLRTMAPGEKQSLDNEWYAGRCPGPIVNVTSAGCCHEPLQAISVGDETVRLTGIFGVFCPSAVQVIWVDHGGNTLGAEAIAQADPKSVFHVDAARRAPAGVARVELALLDEHGQSVGTLDTAVVTT